MRLEEKKNLTPICSFCEAPLETICAKKIKASFFGVTFIYCCPSCKKVLGVSQRKSVMAG